MPVGENESEKYIYFYSFAVLHYLILCSFGLFLIGALKINYLSAISAGYSLANPGYIYIFSSVFAFNILILILLGLSGFNKKYLFSALIFHLLLFPLGIRQLTMTFILQVVILYLFQNNANRNFFTFKNIIIAIAGFIIFGAIGSMRGEGLLDFDFLSLIKAPISFYFFETTFNYLSFLKALNLYDQVHFSFLYGASFLDPLVGIIPRDLFPDKAQYQFFANFIEEYRPYANLKPVGTAHLLTEFFVDGGYFGILLFSFVLGLIGYSLQRNMEKALLKKSILMLVFFAAIIPFFLIQLNRGGISVLFKLILEFALIPVLIVPLFMRRIKGTITKNTIINKTVLPVILTENKRIPRK
jgi:hypothetical protein